MTNNINIELVNGQSGDPAVCVNFTQSGDSILFDAGMLESLSNREILKIKVVAISHTHMDHFIGFDRILRVNVPHFRTVEIVGPQGIAKNVQGKLVGYTWNLLEQDQITYVVHEVASNFEVFTYQISNNNGFVPTLVQHQLVTENEKTCRVKIPLRHGKDDFCYDLHATIVNHRMDVLAFSLTLPANVAVNKTALAASGLKTGPWVSELQQAAKLGLTTNSIIIDGKAHTVQKLSEELLESRSGDKILYVTDMSFTEANLIRVHALANPPPRLVICEANFQHKDRPKAVKTAHLTTTQAALIAAVIGATELRAFHFSNSYANDLDTCIKESEESFQHFNKMTPHELREEASREFS